MMTANLRLYAFAPEHASRISPVRHTEHGLLRHAAEASGDQRLVAWTFMVQDRAVAIWGAIHHWPGRASLWCVMGDGSGPAMLGMIRQSRAVLDRMSQHRLELDVRADYQPGMRLAHLLGFHAEAVLRNYYPDRCDAVVFARVRP